MKKFFALLTLTGILMFGVSNFVIAQKGDNKTTTEPETEMNIEDEGNDVTEPAKEMKVVTGDEKAPQSFHQILKEKFIEGSPGFMGIVLLTLIFGLALVIERVIYLNLSTTNTRKLLNKVETALGDGGIDAAKEVCKNTRGPVAGIFFQGLERVDEGIDSVEKSIISYGGVLMGRLEKGLSWISLFIALAPMLGFMGTVIGMISAFDDIAIMGDISPAIVASGIKMALLTTVFGLIVAIILQIFYNYLVAKIDGLVNDMEDSSITFVDMLSKYTKN